MATHVISDDPQEPHCCTAHPNPGYHLFGPKPYHCSLQNREGRQARPTARPSCREIDHGSTGSEQPCHGRESARVSLLAPPSSGPDTVNSSLHRMVPLFGQQVQRSVVSSGEKTVGSPRMDAATKHPSRTNFLSKKMTKKTAGTVVQRGRLSRFSDKMFPFQNRLRRERSPNSISSPHSGAA